MKKRLPLTVLFVLVLIASFAVLDSHASRRCDPPPFIGVTPRPNILMAFDNSASMYDLAYQGSTFCYDNSYDPNHLYYGYYDNNIIYKYNVQDNYFLVKASQTFSCSDQDSFCVDTDSNIFEFTGNFLNWLTMSKFDVVKRSLTGGKYHNDENGDELLIGESRGCVGRRFVKEIEGSGVVFAVRGSEKTHGTQYGHLYSSGTTKIEIFSGEKSFNFDACHKALQDVESGKLGDQMNQKNISECLNYSGPSQGRPSYNHAIHACWFYSNHGKFTSVNQLKNSCERVYENEPELSWESPSHPAYVCSSKYVGNSCYNIEHGSGQSGDRYIWDDVCVENELKKFCQVLEVPEVIDPSSEFESTGQYANVPAMLIDSGVFAQLGPPAETVLWSRKRVTSDPEGILHDIKDRANIGLMAFNEYGTKYEFGLDEEADPSRYYADPSKDRDGGQILSEVGPDNSHLIQAFNDLEATSWTPIGEMLYEGTRYFRGKKSAYNDVVPYESPIEVWCQHNAVLLFSDGESTYDKNIPGAGTDVTVEDTRFDVMSVFGENEFLEAKYSKYHGTNYGKAVSYWAHSNDMVEEMEGSNLHFYTVFALGNEGGSDLLDGIARYGGYRGINDDGEIDHEGEPENFFTVAEPSQLSSSLMGVFSRILQSTGSAGAVATVTQQIEGEDIVVRGAFTAYEPFNPNTFVWRGHLETYWPYEGCSAKLTQAACENSVNCSWEGGRCVGLYDFQKEVNTGKFCGQIQNESKQCWDAQDKMSFHSDLGDRNIFTMLDGEMKEFTESHLCHESGPDWFALGGDGEDFSYPSDCPHLVHWVRGHDDGAGGWEKGRDRKGYVLGDIVYSTPVVVGQPSLSAIPRKVALDSCRNGSGKECFYHYVDAHRERHKMIYVGGNDGMLHAFLAGVWWDSESTSSIGSDPSCQSRWIYNPDEKCCGDLCSKTAPDIDDIGKEVWGYIPSNLLSELKEIARPSYGTPEGCRHIPMVDLSPQVYDVFIDPSGSGIAGDREWRTVLVGGQRGGGDVYFAIDITDPDDPMVLWEYSVLRNHVEVDSEGVASQPYLSYETYEELKNLPISFSAPGVGRLRLDGLVFDASLPVTPVRGDDLSDPTASTDFNKESWNHSHLSGWVAFITGSSRIFNPFSGSAVRDDALLPHLLAIDIERGINLFQYTWPELLREHQQVGSSLPEGFVQDNTETCIPYALSAPAVLDIWDSEGEISGDGYTDHLYFGDITGRFYGVKFHPSESWMKMDVRHTKPIGAINDVDESLHNFFRSDRQPITAMPVVAFDPQYNLRVYFGTGKFENVWELTHNDMTDEAKMSLYSFKDYGKVSDSMGTSPSLSEGNLKVQFYGENKEYWDGCAWVATDGKPNDCVKSGSPCWTSIHDFTRPGERVVGSALVAGELLFVTTFVPETDPCGANIGESYLYIFDYLARPLKKDPLENSGWSYYKIYDRDESDTGARHIGSVAELGTGMPSQPVLDSSGKYVLVQTSDAKILKIHVDLNQRPFYFKGWVQEDEE